MEHCACSSVCGLWVTGPSFNVPATSPTPEEVLLQREAFLKNPLGIEDERITRDKLEFLVRTREAAGTGVGAWGIRKIRNTSYGTNAQASTQYKFRTIQPRLGTQPGKEICRVREGQPRCEGNLTLTGAFAVNTRYRLQTQQLTHCSTSSNLHWDQPTPDQSF